MKNHIISGICVVLFLVFAIASDQPSPSSSPSSSYSNSSNSEIWTCKWCKEVAHRSGDKYDPPDLGGCSARGWDTGQGIHAWGWVGRAGSNSFRCGKCNLRVRVALKPFNNVKFTCFAGRKEQYHDWIAD